MPAHRLLLPAARTAVGLGAGLALTGCVPDAAAGPPTDAVQEAPRGPVADGAFSGSGTYETPGGPQRLDVTVVLADGVVQQLRVDPAATNQTSRRFQERFASVVVDAVVGRPVAEVTVDRLAGSSSTGAGFMAAIDEAVRRAADA